MSTETSASIPVNSQHYWEERFASDWEALGGRQQSRAFMDLLIKYLPAAVYEEIAGGGSLLDCGCAMGDGTAVLAQEFPRSRVSGFDFSGAAIEAARRVYPEIDFFVSDFEGLERHADVLLASHCFEHLASPIRALRRLAAQARRSLILLVPFLESYPPHHEHRRVVHASTFPEEVDGWRLIHRVLLPPIPAWQGNQLLLVYQPGGEGVSLAPLPSVAEIDQQMRLRSLEGTMTGLVAGVQHAGGEIQGVKGAVAGTREALDGTREVLDGTREALDGTREALDGTREVLEGTREVLEGTRETLDAGMQRLAGELVELRHHLEAQAAKSEGEVSLLRYQLAEASRELAAREERVRQLEGELRQGHVYLQSIQEEREKTIRELGERLASLESEREALRVEVESWRWDATSARRELFLLQTSRLWRVANLYWRLRRRLGLSGKPRRVLAGEAAAPRPAEASAAAVPGSQAPAGPGVESSSPVPPGFPRTPASRYDVIVFSIIDWDFRFQRPQQIATQLGHHGHRVFYLSVSQFVPPDGPAWTMAWKAKNVVEVRVRARRALDIYGGCLEEEDLACLEESLSDLLEDLALGDVVSLVQIPFWAPLADRLRELYGWRVVYDCMDEWTNFPGFGEAVLRLEDELVREADLTIATARLLYEKLDGRAARLLLARNGVDLEHYRRYYGPSPVLEGASRPVIGYYGALASWVDVELLEKIARRFSGATIVLAGGVFDVDLSGVEGLPNVRLLGQRPYEEMPRLLWHFDACVIPFLVNDITEATNPVKFYEYISAGKPVVAPRLTELLPYEDLCYLAASHDEFLAGIEQALAEPADDPRRERRREVAEENDWAERYAAIHAALVETFPLVSVIVVTYGGLPLTRRCLDSLLDGETWPRFEVLVVDNASPDGTPEYLLSVAASDARVQVFFQERNLGFPAANNVGLRHARGEVVLLLNNDTVVPPGMIGRLVRHLQRDPEVGILCATTNFCGNEARVEPGYDDLAGMPRFAAARARHHAGRLMDLQVAAMYCVAARREVLDQVGPLDEAFGIGMFEDDDYALRVRRAGYRVACAEDAYVHHVGQGSFQTLSAQEYQVLWDRNQAHYETKWKRKWKPHALRSGVAPVLSKVGRS
jgi:GT2 family glycosyltransferase/SAM-dependent methyltransferase